MSRGGDSDLGFEIFPIFEAINLGNFAEPLQLQALCAEDIHLSIVQDPLLILRDSDLENH